MKRHPSIRVAQRGLLILAAIATVQLLVIACGSDDDVAPSPQADGGDSGTVDGGTPDPPNVAACKAYITAQCNKTGECSDPPAPPTARCLGYRDLCPDFYFGPGSTRTPDDLFACAAEEATFTCDDLKNSKRPARCPPGPREGGAPCEFNSQCTTGACTTDPATGRCGTCEGVLPPDAFCINQENLCPPGTVCNRESTGLCGAPVAPLSPASVCSDKTVGCGGGTACLAKNKGADAGTCAFSPEAGAPCAYTLHATSQPAVCASDAYCDGKNCSVKAGLGQPCGTNAVTRVECAGRDLYCPEPQNVDSSKCVARVPPGGACPDGRSEQCDDHGHCEGTTCVAYPKVGESCASAACTIPSSCLNLDDAGSYCIDSTDGGGIGDTCQLPLRPCRAFLQCVGGACQRRDLSACENPRDD